MYVYVHTHVCMYTRVYVYIYIYTSFGVQGASRPLWRTGAAAVAGWKLVHVDREVFRFRVWGNAVRCKVLV
jgi:hypothetical protein